jgi:uncharacterized protein YgiM (DUF1202 family)
MNAVASGSGRKSMKKAVILLLLIGILTAGVTPVYAGRYPAYRYHHHSHPASYWGAFGVGIITGSIVANLFYGPPARTVIVEPAPPVVLQPAPVIVQRSYAPVNPPAATDNWVSVATPILNVRSGPGMNFPTIGRVYQGDLLFTKGTAPQWVYVRLPNGNFGWVMARFISQTPASAPASG